MKVYDAIMKAADHIEANPIDFSFFPNEVPKSCGTPGCASGWIGHFSGISFRETHDVAKDYLGLPLIDFLQRMDRFDIAWHNDPVTCARNLRRYAAEYHASAKAMPPDWNAIAAKQTVSEHERSQELA